MGAHMVAVLALLAAEAINEPKRSADVVEVRLYPGSLADGLETYYVVLKVRDGWSLYANTGKGKADANAVEVIEFLADGKRAGTSGIEYPRGKPRRSAKGTVYQAYDGKLGVQCWVVHDDVKDARVVSVRVRVVATDGRERLAESIVTARYK